MTKKNKFIAFILAIAVFFALVLSVCVITHNADHDCVGSGCQVCQQVESAQQRLKNLISGMLVIAVAFVFAYTIYQFICCFAHPLLQGTLVALKIKLLN